VHAELLVRSRRPDDLDPRLATDLGPLEYGIDALRLFHNLDLLWISQLDLSFAVIVNELPGHNYLFAFQRLYVGELREIWVLEHCRDRSAVIWIKIEDNQVPVPLFEEFADRSSERSFLPNKL